MRKKSLFLLLIVPIVLSGCWSGGANPPLGTGEEITDLLLPAAERPQLLPFEGLDIFTGEETAFVEDAGGRVRMLSFFSTGCPSCVNEILRLQPELPGLREKGVDLYVVAMGQEEDIKSFFDQHALDAFIIHDKDYKVAEQYYISGVPTTFLVDKQGKVALMQVGWGGDTFETIVAPGLSGLLQEGD